MDKNVKVNDLIVMAIIAFGELCDNYGYVYEPTIPSCYADSITLNGCDATLKAIGVNSNLEVECLIIGTEGQMKNEAVFCPLKDIRENVPSLYVAIVTHLNDMIEFTAKLQNP